jgi:uncharacterized protein (DUF4415 family)
VKKNALTKRYTAEKLAAMRARGETKSDWKQSATMTYRDIERSIAADPDEAGMIVDWKSASAEMPQPKAVLNMRIDRRVLDYFRKTGPGYQTRINAVLSAFVKAQRRRAH